MISATTLKALKAAGCSADQIIAAVEAEEAAELERAAARREADRQRKRRARAADSEAKSKVASAVSGGQTGQGFPSPDGPPKEIPQTPLEITPPISPTLFGLEDAREPSKPKRASRLPSDWVLPRAWGQWALSEFPGITEAFVRNEANKFRDHWLGKSGQDATKMDWQATWRNWMRRAFERGNPRASPAGFAKPETVLERRSRELAERIKNEHGIGREGSGDPQTPAGVVFRLEDHRRSG